MNNVIFCRIGSMNYYQGLKDDTITGGEKYLQKEHTGGEIYNFRKEYDDFYYGYVEPGSTNGTPNRIHVEKLGGTTESADHVLVIWVANKRIVGWYEDAEFLSLPQRIAQTIMSNRSEKNACLYNVRSQNAVLLPPEQRTQIVDVMGQRMVSYGNEEVIQECESYIQNYKTDRDAKVTSIENSKVVGDDIWKYSKQRVKQDVFRTKLLERNKKCALCGVSMESCLIASHIKPWRNSTPEEKLDANNGLLLCPNHDKLFDIGLISFDEEGKIMISAELDERTKICMNVDPSMRIEVTSLNAFYLAYHRENIFH